MAKIRQVALAFPLAAAHYQQVCRGITDYAQQHGTWSFAGSPETHMMLVTDLKGWPGNGVIAEIHTKKEVAAARELDVPVVNLSGVLCESGLPRVMNDHRAMGRLAAEHLLECGLRRFAYYGLRGVWYAQQRGRGFVEQITRGGGQCTVWEAASSILRRGTWPDWLDELRGWLRSIEPPLGIMAVHDGRARMVVDVCHQLGLRVPHDVAVVGVNDDPIACEFSRPTLSSVARNGQIIGRQAAALLDRLMSGRRPPARDTLIAPEGVVKRQSTDVVAVEDPEVSAAVRFIREHFTEPIGVENLLAEVSVSRRWLEHRFKRHFGCTPHQYICQTRVERAKQLLTGAEKLPLSQIAAACGFSETRHLRIVFQRITGLTPAQYRRKQGGGGKGKAEVGGGKGA